MLAILYDQTGIVSFILEHEQKIDIEECFFNRQDIHLSFTTGRKTIPCSHYYDLLDRLGTEYRSLLERKEELENENEDTSKIEAEIEEHISQMQEYEEVTSIDRTIYEWRLIPHWLAERLIHKGETVFKYSGCNWWGIKEVKLTGIFCSQILKEIYEDNPP